MWGAGVCPRVTRALARLLCPRSRSSGAAEQPEHGSPGPGQVTATPPSRFHRSHIARALSPPRHVTSRGGRSPECQRRCCDGGGSRGSGRRRGCAAPDSAWAPRHGEQPRRAARLRRRRQRREGAALPREPRRGGRDPRRRGCCAGSGSSW